MDPLIHLVLVLLVIGVLLWVVFRFIPLDPDIRQIIKVVVIIAVILYIVSFFFGGFGWGYRHL